MHLTAVNIIAAGAATILGIGVVASVTHNMIPTEYDHNVNMDGYTQVDINVDVTVHTPDLDKLKPGTLIPSTITVQLPKGFTLNLPDSTQTVDVKAPTEYQVNTNNR